jgi:hypothetical protein
LKRHAIAARGASDEDLGHIPNSIGNYCAIFAAANLNLTFLLTEMQPVVESRVSSSWRAA